MKATVARLQPSAPPLEQRATCNVEPATPVAGEADGRFPLHASVAGLVVADIASLIVIGNEAAATGRPRDAGWTGLTGGYATLLRRLGRTAEAAALEARARPAPRAAEAGKAR